MEKDKDIIEIIADEPYDVSDNVLSDSMISDEQDNTDIITEDTDIISPRNKITAYLSQLPRDLSLSFIIPSAVICAAVVVTALILGIMLPKSDNAVSKRLAALHETDKTYIEAIENKDTATREKENTDSRLAEKQKELEEFNKSQDNLNKISESNDALKKEKEALQDEIKKKQNTLTDLDTSVTSQTKKIITWSSGRYTVGKNIAPGNYTVTGSGSISIGNSGKSLANKNLKSSGEVFTLNDGDVIQIDGNAKFIPE
ncbi:MAG: hypothetical protein ACI4A5_03125 [Hominilimicola sp.]